MLRESALKFKKRKKKLFLFLFKTSKVSKHLTFQATAPDEQVDVTRTFGPHVAVKVIPNFAGFVPSSNSPTIKKSGEISLIFLARLHPIKNLDFILRILPVVSGRIQLSVVGSEEDKSYVAYCHKLIADLPANIKVELKGEMAYNEVQKEIKTHQFLILPTQGENFGHSIFEALRAGKPVIISDQTPWQNLSSNKAGWSLPLNNPEAFRAILQQAVDFDQSLYNDWSNGSWNFVREYVRDGNLKKEYEILFN